MKYLAIVVIIVLSSIIGSDFIANYRNKVTISPAPSIIPTQEIIPTITNIPDTPTVIPIPTSDNVRIYKVNQIASIDLQINLTIKDKKALIDVSQKNLEEANKCQDNWCKESYLKVADFYQKQLDKYTQDIKDLELRRATIVAGL